MARAEVENSDQLEVLELRKAVLQDKLHFSLDCESDQEQDSQPSAPHETIFTRLYEAIPPKTGSWVIS